MLVRMTNETQNHWDRMIALNRAALLRIVAMLFVYAGLDEGGADVLPRHVWRRVLRLLRPAEAALRRLIVVAAHGVEIELPVQRAEKPAPPEKRISATGFFVIRQGVNLGVARAVRPEPPAPVAATTAARLPVFALVDPGRRFDARAWEGLRPFPSDGFQLADANEPVDARRLCRRLLSLKAALDDLPGQAARLARLRARRRSSAMRAGRPEPLSPFPLRRGHPPGWRRRVEHTVDDILAECHALATDRGPTWNIRYMVT